MGQRNDFIKVAKAEIGVIEVSEDVGEGAGVGVTIGARP